MTSRHRPLFRQWRLWYLTVTHIDHEWVVWLAIGGRKPLAHLPAWKRRWLHPVPVIRKRLL